MHKITDSSYNLLTFTSIDLKTIPQKKSCENTEIVFSLSNIYFLWLNKWWIEKLKNEEKLENAEE